VNRRILVGAAAVIAVILVVNAPVLLGGQTWADDRYQGTVVPARLAVAAAVSAGHLPQWWDGSGLGVPLLAEPSFGALYPANWALPSSAAVDLWLWVHLALAGVGTMLLTRRLGAGGVGAALAGMTYGGCGVGLGAALHGLGASYAWAPWLGWALAAVPLRPGSGAAVALLTGVMLLAGSPELALVTAALALLTLGVVCGRAAARRAAPWLGIGVLLAAVQWVPSLALWREDIVGPQVPALGWSGLLFSDDGRHGVPQFMGGAVLLWAIWGAPWRQHRGLAVVLLVVGLVASLLPSSAWSWAAMTVLVLAGCLLAGRGIDRFASAASTPALPWVLAWGALLLAVCAATFVVAGTRAGLESAALTVGMVLFLAVRGRVMALVLAACTVAQMVVVVRREMPWVPRETLDAAPLLMAPVGRHPVARQLAAQGMRPRILVSSPVLSRELEHREHWQRLPGDAAARFGGASARSKAPSRCRREDLLWQVGVGLGASLPARLGIEFIAVPSSTVAPAGFERVAVLGDWTLVPVPGARPRGFVAHRFAWSPLRTPDELRQIFSKDAAPAPTVILEGQGAPDLAAASGMSPCALSQPTTAHLVQRCDSKYAGYAVALVSRRAGWEATVNDRPSPVVTADGIALATPIGAGVSTVEWRFRTPGLTLGLWLSGLGLLAFVVMWVAPSRRRAVRLRREPG
jgi:hypothetical protein